MDSGLARFAVLILLFFVMTGDLAGIVRQLYDETSGYGSSKQQQQQQAPVKRNGARVMMSDKGSITASASAPAQASATAEGEGEGADPDIEAFGEQHKNIVIILTTIGRDSVIIREMFDNDFEVTILYSPLKSDQFFSRKTEF